jgi:hypothetical protein
MWRVSSAAHNLATVDGQDCVPIVSEFLFGGTILPLVDDWRSDPRFAYFSGVHEGYLRLPEKVSAYRRKVFHLRGEYWIVIDRFTAVTEAEHEYQLHFHVKVPSKLRPDGRLVTEGSGGNLLIVPVPGADGTPSLAPNPYPIKGYENPDHLTYTRRAKGSFTFVTLLVPFEGSEPPQVSVSTIGVHSDERILSSFEATALHITLNGRDDVYFDQHMHWNLPWEISGCSGRCSGSGRLFHSRCAHY